MLPLLKAAKKFAISRKKYWNRYPKDIWVNTYIKSRHYGGAEEGGWWYDNYECIESIKCKTAFDAFRLMASINNTDTVTFCEKHRAASQDVGTHYYS